MADKGSKVYKGNASVNRGSGGQLTGIRAAAKRRLQGANSGQPGGGPSGGKRALAPNNARSAGSMVTNNPHNGVYSTFVRENWSRRKRG